MGSGISTINKKSQDELSCLEIQDNVVVDADIDVDIDTIIYLYTKYGVIKCINMVNECGDSGVEMSKNEMIRFIYNCLDGKTSSYRIWTNISSNHNKKNYNLVMSVNCKSNMDEKEILNFMI